MPVTDWVMTTSHNTGLHCPAVYAIREKAGLGSARAGMPEAWLRHEWRQFLDDGGQGLTARGYYCIHCCAEGGPNRG